MPDSIDKNKPSAADLDGLLKSEFILGRANECLLSLGSDYSSNISRLVSLCGELFGASFALYNRLDNGVLKTIGSWNVPEIAPVANIEDFICHEPVRAKSDGLFVIKDLRTTRFNDVNPNVARYGLVTFFGHAVFLDKKIIGVLSIYYTAIREASPRDEMLIKHVADAIGKEEGKKIVFEKFRENEEKLFMIAQAARDGILIMDNDGNISFCNSAAEGIFGYGAGDMTGKKIHEFLAPSRFIDDYNRAFPKWKMTGEGGAIGKTLELAAIKNGGEEITIELSLSSVMIGGLWNAVGVVRDITEKKKTARELTNLKALLETSFIQSAIPMILISFPDMVLRIINPAAREVLGISDEEDITGRSILECHPTWKYLDSLGKPIPLEEVPLFKALSGIVSRDQERRVIRKDGTERTLLASAAPIYNPAGELIGVFEIFPDITSRKIFEAELTRERDRAETASRAKSIFMANMSHEVRTPMNGILGFVGLLETTSLNKIQREFLDIIKISADHLLEIINDILDLSKMESGKLKIEKRHFNVRELLEKTFESFVFSRDNDEVALKLQIPENFDVEVIGDGFRLRQILSNLLSNALKFTTKGSVELIVSEKDPGDDNSVCLEFHVKDTGIGIPPENIDEIFDIFHQLDESSTKKHSGAGLGLSIVKNLVELMHGRIRVESKLGSGSVFSLEIPFARAVAGERPVQLKKDCAGIVRIGHGKKILVVEDDVVSQKLITGIFRNSGHVICIASNGETAIELFEKNKFDLILMDIQMPVMDGVTATRLIREKEAGSSGHVPIIALTAFALIDDRERFMAAGMDDYVSKPVDIKNLWKVLKKYIE